MNYNVHAGGGGGGGGGEGGGGTNGDKWGLMETIGD